MKSFLICTALTFFLLGCIAVEKKEFAPMKKGLRINPAEALQALRAPPAAVTTLRANRIHAEAISGSVSGGYIAIDVHTTGLCLGGGEGAWIWKAGACAPAYDDNGAVTNYAKAACFTDTSSTEIAFYSTTDPTCTGPVNYTIGSVGIACNGGFSMQCFPDLSFTKRAYAKELFLFVYPTQQSYENTRIDEASFLELVPDMSGTIMSIADEDRSECAYLLPSNPPVCQDTRNAKSVSFFGRDFNRGTMTLYSNFGGRGVTMSLDYTSPSRQMVDGNWVAYGYLKGDWYKRYVQHM